MPLLIVISAIVTGDWANPAVAKAKKQQDTISTPNDFSAFYSPFLWLTRGIDNYNVAWN